MENTIKNAQNVKQNNRTDFGQCQRSTTSLQCSHAQSQVQTKKFQTLQHYYMALTYFVLRICLNILILITVRAFFEQPTFAEYMNVHVKNLGMTRESIPEGGGNMRFKDFMIEHITGHWPCVFRELATSWPAIQKWANPTYLSEIAGHEKIILSKMIGNVVQEPFMKEYRPEEEATYTDFLANTMNHFLIKDRSIPKPLLQDISEPKVTQQILKIEDVTIWQDKSSIKTLAHSKDKEAMICVVKGELKMTVVPPWERLLVYPGQSPAMPRNFAAVDFFRPDSRLHQHFNSATPFDIPNLKAGDCMFLPSYWWRQFESQSDSGTIVVTFWYEVASEWIKLLFYGLENNYI